LTGAHYRQLTEVLPCGDRRGIGTMAGKGRAEGGNSGRQPRPPKPVKGRGPVAYLKDVVRDENSPSRDAGAAGRALLNHHGRLLRAKKLDAAAQAAIELENVGWMSDWHAGFSDGTPPDAPWYGTNPLAPDLDERRDPRTGKPMAPVPEWHRKLRSFHLPWWPHGSKPEFWWRTFTEQRWAVVVEETEDEWMQRRGKPR
jgi:hypothetical protein